MFTTGTVSRQKRTGARVNYFPVKAVQTFDLPASKITNGIFFGDWAAVRFFGPMEFNEESRKLTFDFTRIELFGGALGFDLGKGGAAEIGAATGLGSENNVKLAEQGKKPFFNWIDCDDVIATARGGGACLALWTRTERRSLCVSWGICLLSFRRVLTSDNPGTDVCSQPRKYTTPHTIWYRILLRFDEKGG